MIEQDKLWSLAWEMFLNKKQPDSMSFTLILKKNMDLKTKLMRLFLVSVEIFIKLN
jgi:hypothetical protein